MIHKTLIVPDRVRRLPAHWSWIDHRLVRDHHLKRCSPRAWTLYLMLVSVGDAQGLSYYSEAAICRLLPLELKEVRAARQELIDAGFLAFAKPLYQVLDLAPTDCPPPAPRGGRARSLSELLEEVLKQQNSQGAQP
jgi:hypothetical protein